MRILSAACIGVVFCVANPMLYTDTIFSKANQVTEYYAQQDYSLEISELATVAFVDDEHGAFIQHSDLIVDDLTSNEDRLLSLYKLSDSYYLCCEETIRAIFRLARATGEIPRNGIEVLNLNHSELLTEGGLAEFRSLSRRDQLRRVRRGINPVTGRFYSTFASAQWHAFGIYFVKLEGAESVKEVPVPPSQLEPGEEFKTQPHQGWRIVIFGEEPGTTLIDKTIWTKMEFGEDCGC